MFRKIMCIVLVVAIVGAAIGFFVYDKVGKTYDYESKNLSKYFTRAITREYVKGLVTEEQFLAALGASEWKQISAADPEFGYRIAEKLYALNTASTATKLEDGSLAIYDVLTFVYYVALVDDEGKEIIVSDPTLMNVTADSKTAIQLGTNPVLDLEYPEEKTEYSDAQKKDLLNAELSGILTEGLLNKEVTPFKVFKEGNVFTSDVLWVEYTVEKRTDATATFNDKHTYKYQKIEGMAGLNALLESLGATEDVLTNEVIAVDENGAETGRTPDATGKVYTVALTGEKADAKQTEITLGKEFTHVLKTTTDEKKDVLEKVTIKPLFASRALVTEGSMVDGDIIHFNYKAKDSTDDVTQMVITVGSDADKAILTGQFKDTAAEPSFYDQLVALKVNDASKKTITITEENAEGKVVSKTEWEVSIEYVRASATAGEPAEGSDRVVAKADPYIKVSGDNVKYTDDSVAIRYDAEGNVMKNSESVPEKLAGKKIAVYVYPVHYTHTEFKTFDTIYKDLKFTNTGDETTNALLSAYSAKKAEEDKGANANTDTLNTLKQSFDNAVTAYNAAHPAASGETPIDVATPEGILEVIYKEYEKSIVKTLQTEISNERAYDVAGLVWLKLEEALKVGVKYPSKAVRLAKKGILDGYKATYYSIGEIDGNGKVVTSETLRATYKNFDAYLQAQYVDQDVDDAIRAEAQEVVFQNMLIHSLADAYNITLTEEEQKRIEDMKDADLFIASMNDGGGSAPHGNWDNYEMQYLADRVMRAIAEDYEPQLKLPE